MKTRVASIFLLAGILMMPAFAVLLADSAIVGDIHLGLVEGNVLINTEDTDDWAPAAENIPLGHGDRVWVSNDSRAELRLPHGTVTRLNSRTALEISAPEAGEREFFTDSGEIYVRVEDPGDPRLAFEGPEVTVRPEGGSIFRMKVTGEGDMTVSVLRGTVRVEGPQGVSRVAAGQRLIFKDPWPEPRRASLEKPDQWEAWNKGRDRYQFEAESLSRRYLPEELATYAGDFDTNGRWMETPEYGFVWTPTVVPMSAWAPYRTGRWVWMRGRYVWIADEKWGWAPHHYGRWAFVRPIGWCWVPPDRRQVRWAPGYVAWVQSPRTVSWVPPAPGEAYHEQYRHSQDPRPGSSQANRNWAIGVNPYKNTHVTHAVTTVHREAFLTGKTVIFHASTNPFKERQSGNSDEPPRITTPKGPARPGHTVQPSWRPPADILTRRHPQRKTNASTRPGQEPLKKDKQAVDRGKQNEKLQERDNKSQKPGGQYGQGQGPGSLQEQPDVTRVRVDKRIAPFQAGSSGSVPKPTATTGTERKEPSQRAYPAGRPKVSPPAPKEENRFPDPPPLKQRDAVKASSPVKTGMGKNAPSERPIPLAEETKKSRPAMAGNNRPAPNKRKTDSGHSPALSGSTGSSGPAAKEISAKEVRHNVKDKNAKGEKENHGSFMDRSSNGNETREKQTGRGPAHPPDRSVSRQLSGTADGPVR